MRIDLLTNTNSVVKNHDKISKIQIIPAVFRFSIIDFLIFYKKWKNFPGIKSKLESVEEQSHGFMKQR